MADQLKQQYTDNHESAAPENDPLQNIGINIVHNAAKGGVNHSDQTDESNGFG
jgi:hypothetical protein